jgi:hypothetical protein
MQAVHALPINSRQRLLASTPITKQPGTLPYRIVLILDERTDQLIVWQQLWSNYDTDPHDKTKLCVLGQGHFEDGSYFTADQLHLALARFAERVARMAPFVETIYRDDA